MAIHIHGPGMHDPYPLERPVLQEGPAPTQPTHAIHPMHSDRQAGGQAAARLYAAIKAQERSVKRPWRADQFMQAAGLILDASTPLGEAYAALLQRGLDEALVVDGMGRLIALLTLVQVVQVLYPAEGPHLEARFWPIREIGLTKVLTVPEDTPFALILRRLVEQDGLALPVVDAQGRPLGLIEGVTLLRFMLEQVGMDDWA